MTYDVFDVHLLILIAEGRAAKWNLVVTGAVPAISARWWEAKKGLYTLNDVNLK